MALSSDTGHIILLAQLLRITFRRWCKSLKRLISEGAVYVFWASTWILSKDLLCWVTNDDCRWSHLTTCVWNFHDNSASWTKFIWSMFIPNPTAKHWSILITFQCSKKIQWSWSKNIKKGDNVKFLFCLLRTLFGPMDSL